MPSASRYICDEAACVSAASKERGTANREIHVDMIVGCQASSLTKSSPSVPAATWWSA
jgi:hypothetical protein